MISAMCSVCGEVTRNPHTCIACGAAVCEKHYDFASGFCPRCRRRLRLVEKSAAAPAGKF